MSLALSEQNGLALVEQDDATGTSFTGVVSTGSVTVTGQSPAVHVEVNISFEEQVGVGSVSIQGQLATIQAEDSDSVQAQIGSGVVTLTGLAPTVVSETNSPEILSTSATATEVTITWSSYENAVNYELEREESDGQGGWTGNQQITGIQGTTYEDTELTPGQTYRYRVRALTEA